MSANGGRYGRLTGNAVRVLEAAMKLLTLLFAAAAAAAAAT
jgi:hypothetical protein